jgi:ribonuclease HI
MLGSSLRFTDGSAQTKRNIKHGGFGVWITRERETKDPEDIDGIHGTCYDELPDCIPTNSINELLAIKQALEFKDDAKEINIISDSQYAIQMTGTN